MTVKDLLPRSGWDGVERLGNFDAALAKELKASSNVLGELAEAKRQAQIHRRRANRRETFRQLVARRINWLLIGIAAAVGFYIGKLAG